MIALWHVRRNTDENNCHWIGTAININHAREQAHEWMGTGAIIPSDYVATELIKSDERWKIEVFQV